MSPIATFIDLYSFVVIGAVIASWVSADPRNPLVNALYVLTEPVLAPIRRLLPPMGGLDLSPMILLMGLQFLRGFVR